MIGSYPSAYGRDAMLRIGAEGTPVILVLQPLFEEANRMRRVLVEVMRGLAQHGYATVLPDLPGTNDSAIATVDARFEHWAEAVRSVSAEVTPIATIAVRGGALLDGRATGMPHWRLSPETGTRLLRDMVRATAVSAGLKTSDFDIQARTSPEQLVGNLIHPELYTAINAARFDTVDARTVRLEGDTGHADLHIPGAPPWRRAEPGDDPTLVAAMVDDIATWANTCVGT